MLGDEVPPMPFSLRQKVSTFTCERMEVPIQAYLIHLIAHDERLFKMGRRAAIKVFSMRRYLRPEETKLYDRLASHSLLKPRYRYYHTSFSTTGYANIHSMRVAQYVVDEQMCQCRHYVGSNWPKHSIGLDSSARTDVHCVYKWLMGLLVCGDTCRVCLYSGGFCLVSLC